MDDDVVAAFRPGFPQLAARGVDELVGEAAAEACQDLLGVVAAAQALQVTGEFRLGDRFSLGAEGLHRGHGLLGTQVAQPGGDALGDDQFRFLGGLEAGAAVLGDDLGKVIDGVEKDVVELADLGFDVAGHGNVDQQHRLPLAGPDCGFHHALAQHRQVGGGGSDDDVGLGQYPWQVREQHAVGGETLGQIPGSGDGAIGDHHAIDTGLAQVFGHQFDGLTRSHQQHACLLQLGEDLLGQGHGGIGHGYRVATDVGVGADPLGGDQGVLGQALEFRTDGARAARHLPGVLDLAEDLRLTQYQGVEAGSHPHGVADGGIVMMQVARCLQASQVQAVVVAHPAQQLAVIASAGIAVEFGAITGGKNGHFGQPEVVMQVPQGVRQLLGGESNTLPQFHRCRDVIETERDEAHPGLAISDSSRCMIAQTHAWRRGPVVWAGLGLALFLGGCATVADPADEGPQVEAAVTAERDLSPPPSNESGAVGVPAEAAAVTLAGPRLGRPAFPTETLYGLLVAELALRQGDRATALEHYVAAARVTRDAGVVAQAAQLALLTRDVALGQEMTALWVEVAAEDPQARQAAALALMRSDALEEALTHLVALRRQTGSANFAYLTAQAGRLEPAARQGLAEALEAVHARFPDDVYIAHARAVLLEGRSPAAALALLADHEVVELPREAALLRARLLARQGETAAAIEGLDQLLGATTLGSEDVTRIRYARARLLIDSGRFDAARSDFEALLARSGEHAEFLLSLALLALEQEDVPAARHYLERLLQTGRRSDLAHYYLGELARVEGDVDGAVAAFGRVSPGGEFRDAQLRASALLLRHTGVEGLGEYLDLQRRRYPDQALTLWLLHSGLLLEAGEVAAALAALDEALADNPGELELHYARALARKRAQDFPGLEADLRAILEQDPDHAMALNALGYILADRNERLPEAKRLIERALALQPDEPAYIDSMGWVEYRLGNLQRARKLLERAFALLPDHEIAAHLGEVLWMLGENDEAKAVWSQGLTLDPDSPVLAETMGRLLGDDHVLGAGPAQGAR